MTRSSDPTHTSAAQIARQTTISSPVRFSHRGLLSGRTTSIRMKPAPANAGIVFNDTVPAHHSLASVEQNRVVLRRDKEMIIGVEHLLAACYGLGIDNLHITVTGDEIPFGDGSALPFVRLLRAAGLKMHAAPRHIQSIARPVVVSREDSFLCALPDSGEQGEGSAINCFIRFPEPVIGEQFFDTNLTPTEFCREICSARTFGYQRLGQELPHWLARSVVVRDHMFVPARFRFANEPARHKTLDLLGDIALLGRRLQAHLFAYKTGHRLHLDFLKELEDLWT